MIPLGLNIFTWNDTTRAVCDQLQPAALLFLDNDGGAAEAATRYPTCAVIARVVNDQQEKHLHESPGATRRYLQMRAPQTWRDVYINLGCEAPTDRLDLLVSETVDGLKWAAANNIKVAAPHGAFYAINPSDFPTLDPLADIIASRPDLFLFTVDEYSGGHAFGGVVDPALAGGNEVGHILPESWKASPTGHYYHAGRITEFFAYRKAKGKPLPLTVITENGMDALGDIATWLKSLHNTGSLDGTRGWQTLTPQWRDWYGARGWSGDLAYAQMMAAQWRQIYAPWPNVIGACLYCYGTNGDRQWDSYRVDGHGELFDQLVKMNWKGTSVTVSPVPKPAADHLGTPLIGQLVTATFVNVRSAPTTAAAIVAQPKGGVTVTAYPVTPAVSADGYDWRWCEIVGASGWMAKVNTSWEAQIVVPKPLPEPVTYLPPLVSLDVPFQSQYGDARGANGCGPASLAMLMDWYAVQLFADKAYKEYTSSDVSTAMHRANGATTSIAQLVAAANQYSVKVSAVSAVAPLAIQDELDAKRPVLILYARGAIDGELAIYAYAGAHYGVVVGYGKTDGGETYYLLREPLQKGVYPAPLKVVESQLVAALKDEGTGNLPNQALFLNASNFPPTVTEPETSLFTEAEWSEIDARILARIQDKLGAGE